MNAFDVCLVDALVGKKTPAQNVHVEYCRTLPRRHALFIEPLKRTGIEWFVRWSIVFITFNFVAINAHWSPLTLSQTFATRSHRNRFNAHPPRKW
jgi:hypothetical protein